MGKNKNSMNREVKFRGKREDNGEWIYGGSILQGKEFKAIIDTVEPEKNRLTWVRVHPETLTQFTGLKDKNGKEIYEGDIVNEWRISRSFPEGRNIQQVVKWENDMTLDDSYGMRAVGFCLFGGTLEVIGNIFESPSNDLVKG